MNNRKEIHDRVLQATCKEELMEAYSEWADHYDTDLVGEMGYVAPALTGKMLQTYLDSKNAAILDAGCGTGLVGKFLYELGYRHIDGVDYSREMLEKAEEKAVYKSLGQVDLMAPLTIADDRYDAVISVGTFTCGHVGPQAFNELIRITRPGGYICFTVREQAWEEDDYRLVIDQIEKQGSWKLKEENTTDYIQKEGSSCKACLYQIST